MRKSVAHGEIQTTGEAVTHRIKIKIFLVLLWNLTRTLTICLSEVQKDIRGNFKQLFQTVKDRSEKIDHEKYRHFYFEN